MLLHITHHIHVHVEWEVLWSSGLVLGQVLDKLRLLRYKTGSKQLVITELVGVEAIQEEIQLTNLEYSIRTKKASRLMCTQVHIQ